MPSINEWKTANLESRTAYENKNVQTYDAERHLNVSDMEVNCQKVIRGLTNIFNFLRRILFLALLWKASEPETSLNRSSKNSCFLVWYTLGSCLCVPHSNKAIGYRLRSLE